VSEPKVVPEDAVHAALMRVLASKTFAGVQRGSALLRFVVIQTLEGRAAYLKEYTLGTEALGRGADFDPRADPIARVEASRLRQRLELYYATEGAADTVVISLPKGGYTPTFTTRSETQTRREAPERAAAGAVDLAPALPAAMPGRIRPASAAPHRALWFALGIAVSAGAIATGAWRRSAEGPPLAPLVQADIDLGAPGVLGSEVGNDLALSPDGSTLVFVALLPDGSTRLFARRLAELAAAELPGTVGARGPFFSPDGRWIGFWAQGSLKKTLVDGGSSPVSIAVTSDLLGASWGENDEIVATLDSTGRLMRVGASGGEPEPISTAPAGTQARWPQHLPGGALLYTWVTGPSSRGIRVLLPDGTTRELTPSGIYGRYLPSGHLLYVDRNTLFAAPFDVAKNELTGTPMRVLDDVATSTFGFAQLAAANDGTLIYQRNRADSLTQLVWLERTGAPPVPAVAEPSRYLWPRLSPDGRRVAVSVLETSDYDIWTYDLHSGTRSRTTAAAGDQGASVWTPDGQFLLYTSFPDGGLFYARDGAAAPGERLLPGIRVPWSLTPDGARVAFHEMSATSGFDLATAPLSRDGDALRAGDSNVFHRTNVYETYPTFSPDGRWVAYGSNASGVWEVYVRAFPAGDRETRVSSRGGRIPAWSRTSPELLYETNDHRLMVASYSIVPSGELVVAPPEPWSPHVLADTGVLANYDLAPDGRVLALVPFGEDSEPARDHATLVLNFIDELERIDARR
jgi:Tol biopolymer transport system component